MFLRLGNMQISFKNSLLLIAFLCCTPVFVWAQSAPEVGIFAGMSTYNGDLQDKRITFNQSHPAVGIFIRKSIYKRFSARLGVTFGKISGADSLSSDSSIQLRNFSFQSSIMDVHLMAEYNFFDMAETGFTPYVFLGLAIAHFDPYAKDSAGQKVYLRPLSTEGQGLSQYPDRKPYNLTQITIPFGAGIKYAVSPVVNIGFEISMRKTFTDYLDDVSTTYVDRNTLEAERGITAVKYAFRRDELPGHSKDSYPGEGEMRGSPKAKDWYYYTGFTVSFNLNGNSGRNRGALQQIKCPPSYRKE